MLKKLFVLYGKCKLLVSQSVCSKHRDSMWNGCSQEDIELCWPIMHDVEMELLCCCVNGLNENICWDARDRQNCSALQNLWKDDSVPDKNRSACLGWYGEINKWRGSKNIILLFWLLIWCIWHCHILSGLFFLFKYSCHCFFHPKEQVATENSKWKLLF